MTELSVYVECNLLRYFQQYRDVDPNEDIRIVVKDCEVLNFMAVDFNAYSTTYKLTILLPYDERELSRMKLIRGGIVLSLGFSYDPDNLKEHVVNHGDTILLV